MRLRQYRFTTTLRPDLVYYVVAATLSSAYDELRTLSGSVPFSKADWQHQEIGEIER